MLPSCFHAALLGKIKLTGMLVSFLFTWNSKLHLAIKKKLDITNIKFHNFILTKKFAKISILIIVSFSFKKNCIELDFSNIEFYMAFFFSAEKPRQRLPPWKHMHGKLVYYYINGN